MILSTLIQRDGLSKVATATPATVATQDAKIEQSVADVATVAVANARELQLFTLTSKDEMLIRSWLAYIEETDPSIIDHVLSQCRTDLDKRNYFIWMTGTVPQPVNFSDDRRFCTQCANLKKNGRCRAAQRGEIIVSRHHEPTQTILCGCEGYMPGTDNSDRLPDREHWSGLIYKGIQQ